MKTAISAILFDKDGTLLDFDEAWIPAYDTASLFAAKGDAALAERFLAATGLNRASGTCAAGSLLAAGNSAEIAAAWIALGAAFPADSLAAELDRIFSERMTGAPALPGLAGALDVLKDRGLRLGVASSDSETAIRKFLTGSGLISRFEFLCGYDSGHGPKPEPGMVHAFAKATGLPPARIAVIGDNTHDLHMARSAGAGLALGVLTGTGSHADLAPLADAVLTSAADLPIFLT